MDTEAPYLRIAAKIRERITRGELRPGDRIPSTRQITREWGVAMATATKAISALRAEQLVDSRPGIGTIVRAREGVSEPARKTSSRAHDLKRDRIVRAAITIADAEGISMLSMRRVATDLNVATMSLYRHVPGKDELMLLMVDAVVAEEVFPASASREWRERLEIAARLLWAIFRRHPWAAEAVSMTRPQMIPSLLTYAEWVLTTLRELGFEVKDMMHTHIALFGHIRGMALSLQSEVQAQQDTGMTNNEWIETQESELSEVLDSGRYPTFEYLTQQQFDFDLDAVFEFGLQRLLDGIEVKLSG